jgi:hypothetical protein
VLGILPVVVGRQNTIGRAIFPIPTAVRTENFVRIDLVTESLNVGNDGRAHNVSDMDPLWGEASSYR